MARIVRLSQQEDFVYPTLHPIVPNGLGTKHIESMTSYLTRLGLSHQMRMLRMFRSVLFSDVDKRTRTNNLPRKSMYSLNCKAPNARRVVSALSEKSSLDGFEYLTWIPIGGLIGEKQKFGGIDKTLKWCSECWQEDIEYGEAPYGRLAWTTIISRVCPSHFTYLDHQCPHCGSEQHMVPLFPKIEFCQSCKKSLISKSKRSPFDTDKEDLWRCRAISRLLRCFNAEHRSPDHDVFLKNLNAICKNNFSGEVKRMERATGLPENGLRDIFQGVRRISFRKYIDLVYRLNIDPVEMLNPTGDLMLSRPPRAKPLPIYTRRESPDETDLIRISRKLGEVLLLPDHKLPPIRHLADELGITHGMLEYRFKNEVRLITARRAAQSKKMTHARHKRMKNGITRRAEMLWADGIYPSDRNLRMHFGVKSSVLRRAYIREALTHYKQQIRPLRKNTNNVQCNQ